MQKQEFYSKSTSLLKSLANPIRLEIVDLLVQGERSVELVASALDLNIKTVSSYLIELFKVNILSRRKEGKKVFYSVQDEDFLKFFLDLRKMVDRNLLYRVDSKNISLKNVIKQSKEKKITILDTRPLLEYEQGHLPQSKSIPISELKDRFLELPKGKTIYLYCRGPYCTFSDEASEFLSKKGFKTIILKKGVLDALDEKIKLARYIS